MAVGDRPRRAAARARRRALGWSGERSPAPGGTDRATQPRAGARLLLRGCDGRGARLAGHRPRQLVADRARGRPPLGSRPGRRRARSRARPPRPGRRRAPWAPHADRAPSARRRRLHPGRHGADARVALALHGGLVCRRRLRSRGIGAAAEPAARRGPQARRPRWRGRCPRRSRRRADRRAHARGDAGRRRPSAPHPRRRRTAGPGAHRRRRSQGDRRRARPAGRRCRADVGRPSAAHAAARSRCPRPRRRGGLPDPAARHRRRWRDARGRPGRRRDREQKVGTWAFDVRTTASGGIAMVGTGEQAIAEALAAADLALNQAKAHGRDQVVSPARAQVVPLRRAAAGPPRG